MNLDMASLAFGMGIGFVIGVLLVYALRNMRVEKKPKEK
jgi:uncharacterized membrane protein (Fun14 family)